MIKEWWNKKTKEEKWKFKATILWFGGGFGILFAIYQFLFAPKIHRFIEQASPSEIVEVENYLQGATLVMMILVIITFIISIVITCILSKKEQKPYKNKNGE